MTIPKRVLITGMGGFIGRHLYSWLRDAGATVWGIDNWTFSRDCEVPAIRSIDDDQTYWCDVIVHAAAMASEHWSNACPDATMRANVDVTRDYVGRALEGGASRVVLLSSCAVYGMARSSQRRLSEYDQPIPVDPYGWSKLAAEAVTQGLCDAYDAEAVVLRLHNVFGPGQVSDDRRLRSVLAIWCEQAWQGQPISVVGAGECVRSWCYIERIKRALLEATLGEVPLPGPINVGGGHEASVATLAEIFCSVAGCSIDPERLPARPEATSVLPDTFLSASLGWEVESDSSLLDEVRATWEWYQHWRSTNDLPLYYWPNREVRTS